MSWQAFIARIVIRRTVKNNTRNVSIQAVRRALDKGANRPPELNFPYDREDVRIGGVPCTWFRAERRDRGTVLFFHGGGYGVGSPQSHHKMLATLAHYSGAAVLAPDYRLAPENPFPAAVDDAVSVYNGLLQLGVDPTNLTVGGDSAGGGLTFALMLSLRKSDLPMPVAIFAFSPWTDLTLSGETITTNRKTECMLNHRFMVAYSANYAGEAATDHPLVSPLFGSLEGLPPALIQVGSSEVLLDDSRRIAKKLEQAGVPVCLEVWPKMPHVWQILVPRVPEARKALKRAAAFIQQHY